MATIQKDLGMVTAYAYAKAGGYQGTEEEFEQLLGNIAGDLEEIENISASAETLPAGSSATASYNDGVLSFGIPEGQQGETGQPGRDGTDGTDGTDGYSPSATVEKVGDTATITITDKDGTTTASVTDGRNGTDGADGRPGADPVAFTVSLPSSAWSNGAQTVSDARFLTGNYCYMVYAAPSDTYAWQDADVYADDVTTAGQMVFHSDATPTGSLTAQIIRLEIAL